MQEAWALRYIHNHSPPGQRVQGTTWANMWAPLQAVHSRGTYGQ